jgi:hypothetical protein
MGDDGEHVCAVVGAESIEFFWGAVFHSQIQRAGN